MKKSILAAGISLLLVFPGAAAEPTTLNGRMERVEDVLYGETRSGSLTERITSADNLIYGTGSSTGVGLDDRVGNLYADVVNSGNDAAPSISSRTNALEYYLTDEIKREPLAGRIGDMEKSVFGSVKSGALDKRTAIGALALGPVGLVGGFFVKGKDVELPAGSELYIQTQKDVTTKGLVTASGAPNMVLRKRVAKSAVAGEAGSTMASDAGSSVNTVENMRNELKFVNEDGDEIDTKTKTVKSDAEETKADVSGTAEKAADEGEENASVVIVRNE